MIRGKQAVLEYFEQINSNNGDNIHFAIYRKGQTEANGSPAIRTPEVEGWNYQKAYDFLNRWLALQQYGEFILIANSMTKVSTRGGFRQDFSISLNESQPVAGIGSPGMSKEEIEQTVNARVAGILEAKEKEKELKDLQAKVVELTKTNKELEKKAADPWTVLIGEIKPYIPDLLVEAGVLKHKVAGVPQSKASPIEKEDDSDIQEAEVTGTDEIDPAIQTRMENVVKKIAIARPDDWLEVLEWFSGEVAKNPAIVETAKKYL